MFKHFLFLTMFFLKYQCRFRKSYPHCHLKMLENWKKYVAKGNVFGALLTDLSKAFDCLDREFLRATLQIEYLSFNFPALRLKHDYLSNRKLRVKIENAYSI